MKIMSPWLKYDADGEEFATRIGDVPYVGLCEEGVRDVFDIPARVKRVRFHMVPITMQGQTHIPSEEFRHYVRVTRYYGPDGDARFEDAMLSVDDCWRWLDAGSLLDFLIEKMDDCVLFKGWVQQNFYVWVEAES